jgi:hypothetical protein
MLPIRVDLHATQRMKAREMKTRPAELRTLNVPHEGAHGTIVRCARAE